MDCAVLSAYGELIHRIRISSCFVDVVVECNDVVSFCHSLDRCPKPACEHLVPLSFCLSAGRR